MKLWPLHISVREGNAMMINGCELKTWQKVQVKAIFIFIFYDQYQYNFQFSNSQIIFTPIIFPNAPQTLFPFPFNLCLVRFG